jgi:hypothetical protein
MGQTLFLHLISLIMMLMQRYIKLGKIVYKVLLS